ncbi:MAG: cold-shock protein [Caldilineaceae bacterium]|nr:cold-shock protein [Caldilineaceae bacterium]
MSQPTLSSCSVCGAPFTDARDHRSAARAQAAACHVCRRHAPAADRERGLVLGFNRRRRFGFLRASDGRRVFCRGAEVEPGRRLRKGDVVVFRRVAGRRGPEAQDVSMEASSADLKAWTARLVASVAPDRGSAGRRGSRNRADSL